MNTRIFLGIIAIAAIGIFLNPVVAFALKDVDVDLATTSSSATGTYDLRVDKGNDCFDPVSSWIERNTGQFNNNFVNHLFEDVAVNTGDIVCVGAFVQDTSSCNCRWGFEFTSKTADSSGVVDFTGDDKLLLTEHTE